MAVTIRVLMDEKISKKQKLFLVSKEARVGLLNGAVLGLLSFAFIGLYLVVLKGQSMMLAFSVSLCTGIALLIAILLSSITGTVIPIIFKKLKNRSCGSFRSAHHYDQRPCCGRHVLWIGLDTVDQCYGIIIFAKAEVLYASAFRFLAYHILIC